MLNPSLTITDLPHLEIATEALIGGLASASTATYADAQSGVAVAGAVAVASGDVAITYARTSAVVRQTPHLTISRASAVAFAYDGQNFDWDRSRSFSVYFRA